MTKKEKISRLFVQSGLCKRKDPVIDKFYLQVQKALSNQRKEHLKNISQLRQFLNERDNTKLLTNDDLKIWLK